MLNEHVAEPLGKTLLGVLLLSQHVLELHFCLDKRDPFLEDVIEVAQEGAALVDLAANNQTVQRKEWIQSKSRSILVDMGAHHSFSYSGTLSVCMRT